jgi:hypothetical protein
MFDLTEPTAQYARRAVQRWKTRVNAFSSIGSPMVVPVPWAST